MTTTAQSTLAPRTVKALRRMCERTVAPTYSPNKMVHDGLFEVAYCEGMDDVLLAFLIEAEAATGQEFSYEVKSTRVRVGLAGAYL